MPQTATILEYQKLLEQSYQRTERLEALLASTTDINVAAARIINQQEHTIKALLALMARLKEKHYPAAMPYDELYRDLNFMIHIVGDDNG